MPKIISVVVPVYNNFETLEKTFLGIADVHKNLFSHLDLEVLFVNDGSKDNSWNELVRLRESYPSVISLINLSRNFGQLGALFAGFNNASGDAVICISADMQDPIHLIGDMVKYWEAGTEIVVCYRQNRSDGFFTKIFSKFAYAISRITYPELPKGGFDYWLMSKKVCELLCSFKGRHNFIQGYLLSVGFSKVLIPYTRVQRICGKSGYNLGKKINIIIDFFVDLSFLPIRFMSCVGIIISLSGFIYSAMIVYAWLHDKTPFSGWAPLMIVTMFLGGMIITMLGVLGEYIWRIYDNSKDFPLFIVDDKLNWDKNSNRANLSSRKNEVE